MITPRHTYPTIFDIPMASKFFKTTTTHLLQYTYVESVYVRPLPSRPVRTLVYVVV